MRVALVGLGLGLVALVGWLLFDLRAATVAPPLHAATSPAPSVPSAAPARPLPIRAPVAPPSAPSPGDTPAEPEETTPPVNPMDVVKMGKTVREWRHYYGERQRAIQEDLYKNEEILDRVDTDDPPTPAQILDAHARNEELKQRMRNDLTELRKIESSP